VATIEEIEQACAKSLPLPTADVVYARMEFPLKARYSPLGFPLELSTNCPDVLEAAAESWSAFEKLFQTPLLKIQVGVLEERSSECPPVTTCRVQQNLFSFIADSENYGISDMARGVSSVWLREEAVSHRNYLRYFFLECAAITLIAPRFVTGVHSACVARNGVGVLLCGDSGAGKTTLAFACAKAGWTYITDDGSYIVHGRDDLLVVGNSNQIRFRPSGSLIFPELNGREVLQREERSKPSIEVNSSDIAGIRHSPTANVHYLVLLNRRTGENLPLRPYSKEVVQQYLYQGRFSPPEVMPLHYATIDRLLEGPVLELRYRDLDWAIEQLDRLAETGRP
jgi:hypothetical protein